MAEKFQKNPLPHFDLIEQHLWMESLNDGEFNKTMGYNWHRFSTESYKNLIENGEKLYQSKPAFDKTRLLTLSMVKIAQSDDSYLKGKLISSTGSGDTYRNYLLGKDDILWDQENVIAIRVRHWGSFHLSKIPSFVAA